MKHVVTILLLFILTGTCWFIYVNHRPILFTERLHDPLLEVTRFGNGVDSIRIHHNGIDPDDITIVLDRFEGEGESSRVIVEKGVMSAGDAWRREKCRMTVSYIDRPIWMGRGFKNGAGTYLDDTFFLFEHDGAIEFERVGAGGKETGKGHDAR